MSEPLAVSVLIPTVGREPLLGECLASIAALDPPPAEVVLVDQSGTGAARRAAAQAGLEAVVLETGRRGISHAMNLGLARVRHDLVLVTHDDCRVRPDWARVGWERLSERPGVIFCGRVLAEDGAPGVPSTMPSPLRREFAGTARADLLYPNNLAISASAALALGGFDEHFTTAAEDNDFCFRWTGAGGVVAYEPKMVVWHRDWRPPAELRRLYRRYWVAQGEMLAKHLALGDRRALAVLRVNLRYGAMGAARRRLGLRRRLPANRHLYESPDWTYAALTHLPLGVARGLHARRGRT